MDPPADCPLTVKCGDSVCCSAHAQPPALQAQLSSASGASIRTQREHVQSTNLQALASHEVSVAQLKFAALRCTLDVQPVKTTRSTVLRLVVQLSHSSKLAATEPIVAG